jgi:hypothetical protein
MARQRAAWVGAGLAVLVALAAAGCGGGGGLGERPQPSPPPAPTGTASISGLVLDASNPGRLIPGATVKISYLDMPVGSYVTDANGAFEAKNLPSGPLRVQVQAGTQGPFWPTELTVEAAEKTTTQMVVALIPQELPLPDALTLQPSQADLDPGLQQQFVVEIAAGSQVLSGLVPSWVVEGGIGTIDSSGIFVGRVAGVGRVVAAAGSARAQARVTVTGAQPPRIWSVFIDPRQHSASGGTSTFTLHVTDGDGVTAVIAQVYKPDATTEQASLARTAGDERDGTWRGSYQFPTNTAPPRPNGEQPAQVYDVRFQVRDRSAASTLSPFYQVTVQGREAPPPVP